MRLSQADTAGQARGWWRGPARSDNQLMPLARLSGPMPWVIAIMVALTVIAAAAGLSLRNTASATAAELSGGVTVQIIEAGADARAQQTRAVIGHLRAIPWIASVHVVPQDEIDALIEPWLGTGQSGDEAIPVPALVDARVTGSVTPQRLDRLRTALREAAPSARVDAQSSWLKPIFGAIESLQWLALALVALLAFALASAVLLAARTALGNNRETIEIIHLLGGTDGQIARIFQRSIGVDALAGGALGFALGLVAVLFLARRFAALGAGLVDSGELAWTDWLALGAIPLAGALLAMVTARFSVMHALRRIL